MRAEDLAVGFVEATTQYDFDPLPDYVQDALIQAAHVFLTYVEPVTVEVREKRHEVEP